MFKKLGAVLLFCAAAGAAVSADSPVKGLGGLKDVFKPWFLIGTALSEKQAAGLGAGEQALIRTQFNAYTPENVMKWEAIHPSPDAFDFKAGDRLVDLATKNQAVVYGHTLVWHSQTPAWVFQGADGKEIGKDALVARMKDHIFKVVGHYKGRIKGWDVVNEALNEDGTLRQSPWLRIIGPEYIALAFTFANQADPDAELQYNDYNIESPGKRAGALRIVKELKDKGIRIDAVGIQGHWSLSGPSIQEIDGSLYDFAEAGVKVNITELDISVLPDPRGVRDLDSADAATRKQVDPYTAGIPEEIRTALSERYRDLFEVFLDHAKDMQRVTFWGVHDGQSWLNYWPLRGRTNYPLLFDRDLKPKAAFQAVVDLAKTYGK